MNEDLVVEEPPEPCQTEFQVLWLRALLGADYDRISQPQSTMFAVAGYRWHTEDDPGQWTKNGQVINFYYDTEDIVGSGETFSELQESVRDYKRFSWLSREEYLLERFSDPATQS